MNVAPTLLAGQYAIVREIGRGGMGRVYEAHDRALGRTVAVKILTEASDPVQVARFEREALAAARIRSPQITQVYTVGRTDDGSPFIVMELLKGEELGRYLRARDVPVPELVDLFLQVCLGIGAAHLEGIVHRDLKPANLFVTHPEGQVKVLDFGVSKMLGHAEITKSAASIGTPKYMAPEQFVGDRGIDGRADVWSIGVMLYVQLAREHPFPGEDQALVAHALRVLGTTPRSVFELAPDVPRELSDVVMRCLSKAPEKRFPSALALADALFPFSTKRLRIPADLSRELPPIHSAEPSDSSLRTAIEQAQALGTGTGAAVHDTVVNTDIARTEQGDADASQVARAAGKRNTLKGIALGGGLALVVVAAGALILARRPPSSPRTVTNVVETASATMEPLPPVIEPPPALPPSSVSSVPSQRPAPAPPPTSPSKSARPVVSASSAAKPPAPAASKDLLFLP